MEFGDNLSNLQNIQFLSARSADELLEMIGKFNLPTKILSIYADSGRHYCWVLSQNKVVKKEKKIKQTKE